MFKKVTYILLCCFCAQLAVAAEMPQDYYKLAEGKQDEALKQALQEAIAGGERYKYGSQSDNSVNLYTWNAFCLTDVRPDGTIWDMYSPYRHHFTYHNRGASGMAIEHSFPKSWWGWGIDEDDTNFAYRDLYHLHPSEHRANGKKNDAMPGVTDSITEFNNGVFKVGYMKGQPYKRVFEPADYYKGDFARAYFYIATCYADYHWIDTAVVTSTGKISKNTCGAYFAMTNDSYLEFQPWLQEILVRWHRQDPVSAKELHRQDIISTIQKNRNPYIDYPELVEYIWGNKAGQSVQFSQLTYTDSDSYTPPLDTQNAVALPASDVHCKGFTAHWQNTTANDYTLRVFTQDTTTTKPDTLINMPGMKATWINANEYMSWDGTNSTSDGDAGMTMGSTKADYTITISGLTIPANTVLRVRANIAKFDNDTTYLKITADGTTLQNIALDFNETYYTIPLPVGAKEIILSQGVTKKRVAIQQLYVITNPQVITRNEITSFSHPASDQTTPILDYPLLLDAPATQMLYYTVQPTGLSESLPIAVACHKAPCSPTTAISEPAAMQTQICVVANQVIVSQIPAQADLQLYDATGKLIEHISATSSTHTLYLPMQGLYLLRVGSEVHKIRY